MTNTHDTSVKRLFAENKGDISSLNVPPIVNVAPIVVALAEEIDVANPNLPTKVRTEALGKAARLAKDVANGMGDAPEGALTVAFTAEKGKEYGVANVTFDKGGNVITTESAQPGSSAAKEMMAIHHELNPDLLKKGRTSVVGGITPTTSP